jgi:predicted RNA binding protein YcfA (HicA-like mRNA interferase family)
MGIAITAARLIPILLKLGFRVVRQVGSHVHLESVGNAVRRVTVPMHNKDLPIATLQSILRQAGISMADFLKILGR